MATRIPCSAPFLDVTRYHQSRGLSEHFIEILLTICYAVEALSVDMQIYHNDHITEDNGEMYNALKYYLTILFSPSRATINRFMIHGDLGSTDERFKECLRLAAVYLAKMNIALGRVILERQMQGRQNPVGGDLVVGSWVTVRHPREILLSHLWDRVYKNMLRSKGHALKEEDLKAYLGRCPCRPTTVRG